MTLCPAKTQISPRNPHEETLGPQFPNERTAKSLIRLGLWCTGHFVGFVMLRLKCDRSYSKESNISQIEVKAQKRQLKK